MPQSEIVRVRFKITVVNHVANRLSAGTADVLTRLSDPDVVCQYSELPLIDGRVYLIHSDDHFAFILASEKARAQRENASFIEYDDPRDDLTEYYRQLVGLSSTKSRNPERSKPARRRKKDKTANATP